MRRLVNAEFHINEKTYLLSIEIGLFKVKAIYLGEILEAEHKFPCGKLVSEIKVDWKNLHILESFKMRLIDLKRYLIKERRKKRSKTRRGDTRDCA